MDDFFGWEFGENLLWYRGMLHPRHQVQLLILWESILCPFGDRTQEHGELLKIIGFWVDSIHGSISLSPTSSGDIVSKIDVFLESPNRAPALHKWQCLAGHLNWLLNVLPWGQPALTKLYQKISDKTHPFATIPINAMVKSDLLWLKCIIPCSIGIQFTDSRLWSDSDADLVLWTDASLMTALAFVYANQGFIYPISSNTASKSTCHVDVFFLELMAILLGIHHVASF
jgi:hypothetical protein